MAYRLVSPRRHDITKWLYHPICLLGHQDFLYIGPRIWCYALDLTNYPSPHHHHPHPVIRSRVAGAAAPRPVLRYNLST